MKTLVGDEKLPLSARLKLSSDPKKINQKLIDARKLGIDCPTILPDEEYFQGISFESEKYVYEELCTQYGKERVMWMNQNGESYSYYDFKVLDEIGNLQTVIECKGTKTDKPTFYLSCYEWEFCLKNNDIYQIYRVFGAGEGYSKSYIPIDNLLKWISKGYILPYSDSIQIVASTRIPLTIHKSYKENGC